MKTLVRHLKNAIGKDRVLTDDVSRIAFGADAGCYRKIPGVVVRPRSESGVIDTLKLLHDTGTPVTFRAAGTSLSGQAVTDSVLLQAGGDCWNRALVLDNGKLVRVQPGITGSRLNQVLEPCGVKFGPDPASIDSAMVGGMLANNAGGMTCSIHSNCYRSLRAARIIFSDGTLLDTSDEESRNAFLIKKPGLIATLVSIRERIRNCPDLVEKITRKYSIKNTMGYGMNAFLDHEDPVDIILYLMVGSEGTLGFISEATFRTVPVKSHRASALIYFKNLETACDAVPSLRHIHASAIELMDREALRSVEGRTGIPDDLGSLGPEAAALLIDLRAESTTGLNDLIGNARQAVNRFGVVREPEITTDPHRIHSFWNVRSGIFPSVGGMRQPGTSVIIEDIAVRADHLTRAAKDLRNLLDGLGYRDAVIYGHALDGNLHFIFAQDFHDRADLERYRKLIDRLTGLIVDRYDGSLKTEHGTGRNMAPFVEVEWGCTIYGMMKEIKEAFDPRGILNPDVILTSDPGLHLKDFKALPEVDESVDRCIECGFCEINCLSTGYTLSARQRIVVQREIASLRRTGENPHRLKKLEKGFSFAGDRTCAGDGLCSLSCPLSIDTGELIKHLRALKQRRNRIGSIVALWTARHLRTVHRLVRSGLGGIVFLRKIAGERVLNRSILLDRYMPTPVSPKRLRSSRETGQPLKVVYFPSCINQSMGPAPDGNGEPSLMQITVEILERAGYRVLFPERMESLCCGTPWESKGFTELADARSRQLEAALLKASDNGAIPVLCDTSPCVYRMKRVMDGLLRIHEPVEFICDHLLDKLSVVKSKKKMAFHVTCSSEKMELEEKFRKVAGALTEQPVFPRQVGCCGFAGDKGFSHPGLNRWALRYLEEEVDGCTEGYSNSRPCEIGLSRNGPADYRSILYLLHRSLKES
ncbi:MAG: FAD-binding and (Fe-S)-binding domain-containing protein [Bacteroidales bacterium]